MVASGVHAASSTAARCAGDYNPRHGHPPLSRRNFLQAGGALVAGACLSDWAEVFAQGPAADAARAEAAETAIRRATTLGASYADIRVNRHRRESIAARERQIQNVSRATSEGMGLRVLVNGAWGFAATSRITPDAARTLADQAVAIARANALLATRKVTLAEAEPAVATWTSAFTRDPFDVPLDTKIGFLTKLNETVLGVAGVSFVNAQILFVDEQKYFASSEGSRITQRLVRTYPQFTATAADRASGDFQTRVVVDRAQLVGYEYVDTHPWLQEAERAGHEVVEKLKARPVTPGRYDIVVDPTQLFLCIHESVGHSTELDRALGYEANMAGTSFLKPSDAGRFQCGSKIVNLVGDRTQPGGLATTDATTKASRPNAGPSSATAGSSTGRRRGSWRHWSGRSARTAACTATAGRACRFRACRTSRSSRRRPTSRSTTCSAASSAACSSRVAAVRRSTSSATTSSSADRSFARS